mmetsp:Transcript_44182/g.94070  ORF Transcript_44182/g.94070 Transcript_44182/m.94070 type:complete len:98 (+) Transcript_44182:97-390(+)
MPPHDGFPDGAYCAGGAMLDPTNPSQQMMDFNDPSSMGSNMAGTLSAGGAPPNYQQAPGSNSALMPAMASGHSPHMQGQQMQQHQHQQHQQQQQQQQ